MITVGVEEEYLLIDPETCLPVPLGQQVRKAAGLSAAADADEVQAELLQAQVEIATPVCMELEEVGGHLLRLRDAVGTAAEQLGCRLAACGASPLREAAPVPVTPEPRYRGIASQAPRLVAEQLINGMHVHAAVPDRATGVQVLNRLRPWLPTLVAMSANSPFWDGEDTGFASWRTVLFGRWPVSGPPPHFSDEDEHERRINSLVSSGAISDRGQVYWHARLSDRYPTVEVRCPDVQLRADDAVMFAGIVRALVATAIEETKADQGIPEYPTELQHAATWHAARHGMSASLIDPEGERRDAADVVRHLLDHAGPALDTAGDQREVESLVHRLLEQGTPADQQRRAYVQDGLPGVLALITRSTTAV